MQRSEIVKVAREEWMSFAFSPELANLKLSMLLACSRVKQVWNNKTGDIRKIKLQPRGFDWHEFIEISSDLLLSAFACIAFARSTRLLAAIQWKTENPS